MLRQDENRALLSSYDDWVASRTGAAQRAALTWHGHNTADPDLEFGNEWQ